MRRGQVSFEFMMVTGIALFIMAASAMFMFNYTQQSRDSSSTSQVAQLGYTLVEEATNVYTFGNGSFVTVTASLPEGVRSMYVVEASGLGRDALVLEVGTQRGIQSIPVFSAVPIRGARDDGTVSHVDEPPMVIHSGRTQYKVRSFGDYVEIRQTS